MPTLAFDPPAVPESARALREETRAFLDAERSAGSFVPRPNCWVHFDAAFTRRCGARGFIGVMYPKAYGGRGLTALDRYVVYEEMLAAGAPVGMHWIADRQTGPLILRQGTEAAKRRVVPAIAAGECCVGVGMSEAGAGSDLAAVRTRAERADGGWLLFGAKLWTSHAHQAHVLTVLARTSPPDPDRHSGLTQFLVDTRTSGVRATPITDLTGGRDFNEVELDGVFVPDECVLGSVGEGWASAMGELTFERSGPERFLSTFTLLAEVVDELTPMAPPAASAAVGRLVAHLATLRQMSMSVAGMLTSERRPDVEAALVKDLGTAFEREVPDVARQLIARAPDQASADPYARALAESILAAPSFTLRGGTREILRGIVARQLGLR